MSIIKIISQDLPDVHRCIFEFHRQIALRQEEEHLADLLRAADNLSIEDIYFFPIYGCEVSETQKKEEADTLAEKIDDSSARIGYLHSYEYI